ncbi:FkbM family methyltransferase [Desulfovibrio inopinatus]|uniref:FkbM family methyltransferase n=1 Tax=Desulfovibrio inopinatus TaxID=102109 RepID=UPI0003FE483E|nr:FkbM family methyltransferase [Desulfovibrio inopinatus]
MRRPFLKLLKMTAKALSIDIIKFTNNNKYHYPIYISKDGDISIALSLDNYEPELDSVFSFLIKNHDGAFIDVGVNVGQTIKKLYSLGFNAMYVGFEPDITSCFLAKRFINANALENHHIIPVAAADKTGPIMLQYRKLNCDPTTSIDSKYRPDGFHTYSKCVYGTRGDEIVDEFIKSPIATIKIDVEGGELEVLKGFSGTITKCSPYIVFEILNHFLRVTKEKLQNDIVEYREQKLRKLENFFVEHEYNVYQIQFNGALTKIQRFEPDREDKTPTNYIAVHKDNASSFLQKLNESS